MFCTFPMRELVVNSIIVRCWGLARSFSGFIFFCEFYPSICLTIYLVICMYCIVFSSSLNKWFRFWILFHIYFQNKRVIIFCSIFYPKDNTGDVKSKSAKCQSIQALGFPLISNAKDFFYWNVSTWSQNKTSHAIEFLNFWLIILHIFLWLKYTANSLMGGKNSLC